MAGLVPGIRVLGAAAKVVDGRDKPGHDDEIIHSVFKYSIRS